MSLIKVAFPKCVLEGHGVSCFGAAWKEDLLPIENHSLERLFISKCTEVKAKAETIDINFLKNVTKLYLLSITDCQLTKPPYVNYRIKSIESIDLSHNQIDTNTRFPTLGLTFFKQFPNLKVLNLTNNRLTYLPMTWFECPSRLEMIILDDNLISGLSPSLADCFIRLKKLSLKRNQFQRLRMPADARKLSNGGYLKETSSLKLFAEQNNMISKKYKENILNNENPPRGRSEILGVIPQFKSLEVLDLSHNKIHSIDQIPLSNLENLIKINLSYNLLSSRTASDISDSECDFGTAPFYIKGKLGLIELDLSANQALTRIHNCWTFGLQNLRILRLENCSISSIYESAFEKMKALSVLDLSHNNLSDIPKELTVVAKTLTWLSLAYNNISQVTSSYIRSLENLRFLNISHNKYQNLMSLTVLEAENKLSESNDDIQIINRDFNSEEVISLLNKMNNLQNIDLSFNDLVKISAMNDLSPSIKRNGRLQKIDIKGNPLISQFVDFNTNDITTSLTEFLINEDLHLKCDCLIIGFIKWITERQVEISGKCSSPVNLSGMSIINPELLKLILNDNSCKEVSTSTTTKTAYKLKLFSNANISQDLIQSVNDPMEDGKQKSVRQKEIVNQKWIMAGSNLTLRCEFLSTYSIDVSIKIEWQRLKMKQIYTSHDDSQGNEKKRSFFLRSEKPDQLDIKYRDKIELLSSNFDPRIKITQLGLVNEDLIMDYIPYYEEQKNIPAKRKDATYKYVSFLILHPVLLNDNGRYRCLINGLSFASKLGQNQLLSKEENLKVYTPPRFTSTPSNPMAIIEGETAEITCRAVGNPLPLTSLGRIGSKDFPAARGRRMTMFKDDSSFFITNVRQVDAGNYTCISRNVAGTIFHNFTLKVQMPATILNKFEPNRTVRVGDALIIRFKMDGIPLPGIKWFKDGEIIMENDRIRFSSDRLMLIIQSSILMDAGIYKISVMNALGGNDAFVYVAIIDNEGRSIHGSESMVKEKVVSVSHDKDQTWISDYWLSGVIIIVILSILLTSILWITIFFCFTKIIGSKKRRILRLSNSQFRNNFNKTIDSSTTSFSNLRFISTSLFKPSTELSIPLSLTTSTIIPHGQDVTDSIDTFTDYTRNSSDTCSTQLFCNFLPYSNNGLLSQSYLSNSGIDISKKFNLFSVKNNQRYRFTDTCDSGIESSQIYGESINSLDIPLSVYQCKHKSKHRKCSQMQNKRYLCPIINDEDNAVEMKKVESSNDTGVDERSRFNMCHKDSCQGRLDRKSCVLPLIR